jgi:lipoate---protein ligase
MATPFRIIDTGVREGRRNIAFDAAMIELHKEGRIGDTIRFLQFTPTVLIGRHQSLSREIRLGYCRANGIGLARRITGGGALYMDSGQLGFELVFHRATLGISSLDELARAVCEATAVGFNRLGVRAKYRPRNDIEVDGRKISGTGGFFDGDTLFYQGTVLLEMNTRRMLAALNVPQEKLAKRALDSAEQRIVTLKELLGNAMPKAGAVKQALLEGFTEQLGIKPRWDVIGGEEEALANRLFEEEIGTNEFVWSIDDSGTGTDIHSSSYTGAGGTIRVHVRLEGAALDRIREVLITGDFFVTPPRTILDLEARLRGTPVLAVRKTVKNFFAEADADLLSAQPDDFADAIESALTAHAGSEQTGTSV